MAPKKTLKQSLQDNPTALGDPVSLKAEKSSSEPTPADRPSKSAKGDKTLKKLAQDKLETNPSQLGDPISLKAETSGTDPTPDEGGAKKRGSKL